MPAQSLIPEFDLKINGQTASADLMRDMVEFVVDNNLSLPNMFTLRIQDQFLKWIDNELLVVGAEIEITATAASHGTQSGTTGQLMKGEITALEPNFDRNGILTLVVRGYDRSHRLHRGKKTRTFLNSTDSDIAQKIARELQLTAATDPTPVVHEYLVQDNQTDLEFLQARAQRIGFELYVKDRTLNFKRRTPNPSPSPELTWGQNLRDFKPRLTTMAQVNEVIVRDWDPKTKREIVGQAKSGNLAPKTGFAQTGGQMAQKAFGIQARAVIVNRPVNSTDEAQKMAQALFDEISGDFIQAEGVCFGDPQVQVGQEITIKGVGQRFSGKYFVTSAIHIYNETGYETHFSINGRQPGTVLNLILDHENNTQGWNMVIGLVTNNKDPDGLGRVKVKFPWLSDTDESAWARVTSPMGGAGRGFFYLPEVNDEVLLAFEHGDINHPYVLGTLWNGKDKPPVNPNEAVGSDGKVNQRVLQSRSGHKIILDDSSGAEKIIIRDKTGRNEIEFDSAQNTITIKTDGKINLETRGDMSLKGQNVTIEGTAQVKIKGATINLN